MEKTDYIQVILPLKLEWEPYYMLADAQVGQRVSVPFAFAHYTGVVSAVNVQPPQEIKNILCAQQTGLQPIHSIEIAFWRDLARYYLCSVGEVYKAAYPARKTELEATGVRVHERLEKRLALLLGKAQRARNDQTRSRYLAQAQRIRAILAGEAPSFDPAPGILSQPQQQALEQIRSAFQKDRTVLLQSWGESHLPLCMEVIRQVLSQGKSVLYLVPEVALSHPLEEQFSQVFQDLQVFHGTLPEGKKRAVATAVRTQPAVLVLGTRSALFLPHHNLGLVIVDGEQDTSYKQTSPAPRYHAREASILLARTQHAQVILRSETPSLESVYNSQNGLFTKVELKENLSISQSPVLLINIPAEIRKNGMSGHYSLKLLASLKSSLEKGEKVLCICRSKAAVPELREELSAIFPDVMEQVHTCASNAVKALRLKDYAVVAVLQADALLVKDDFRSDERAWQFLVQLRNRFGGLLVIQTAESRHPVFARLGQDLAPELLAERSQFAYPPYTRLVDLVLNDTHEKRLKYMASRLSEAVKGAAQSVLGPYAPATDASARHIRLVLSRDKGLVKRKENILATVLAFEKERKYSGHIAIDVDPV